MAEPISADLLQARLAAIVATSDDAIISKNLDGIVESWNDAAQRMFGYTAEEMIGKPITTIFPPDRLHEEVDILARLRRGERIDHYQTIRLTKDGRQIPISVTISPIRDATGKIVGASKIARDLSRSFELEGVYSAIVASSDDAIVGKDLNGVVRSWNAGAERIFGYTAAEMVGQLIYKIIPPDRQDEEPKILERLKRGERVDHFETVRMTKNGRPIDVSVTISPIKDASGQVVGASKIARDITNLKRVLREREQLLESEQAARREAERVGRIKDEFLATLSHELRTPLNAILGWSQLLRSGAIPQSEWADGLETIERNARVQTQLIEELLDMSRIISGKLRLDVQRIELPGIVEAAVESMVPAADAKEIRIQKVIDPKAGPITGDPNRIQQVVFNLLSNAIKFTPKGGRVQVYVQRVNSHVEITVSDTGQGIRPEFLPQVFLRFTQADPSTTRRHGGLGIGLAIVRHLVELHGGTVKAMSPGENQGSTFVISLPLSVVFDDRKEDRTHPEARPVLPPIAMDLKDVRVLVVDDEADSRELIRRLLEMHGAMVTTANSAADAIKNLKEQRHDVLLSDIGMPGEDGYALLKQLRTLEAGAGHETPAVALTAFARSEDRRRALLAGFQMHVPKPVEAGELIAVVANLSGAARRHAQE